MTPEGEVKKEIQDALKAMGVLFVRVNAGTVKVRGGYMHNANSDVADIICVVAPNGRFVGLEVKQKGAKATAGQAAWGADLVARGGFYAVVDSLDAALRALKDAERT